MFIGHYALGLAGRAALRDSRSPSFLMESRCHSADRQCTERPNGQGHMLIVSCALSAATDEARRLAQDGGPLGCREAR
jgi:hypothetical protein